MRRISFTIVSAAIALLIGSSVWAQETANVSSEHAFLVNLGFTRGGMGLGVDYENGSNRAFGWGGYLRMYPDSDTPGNGAAEITAMGAFIRPHFTKQAWDLYVSPGFGIVQTEANGDDESGLGPALMLGLLYQMSGNMAFGVEQMSIYAWTNEDIRGGITEDLLAKFRFSF
jgi:hypothetical protein